jgi:hypothetical protein
MRLPIFVAGAPTILGAKEFMRADERCQDLPFHITACWSSGGELSFAGSVISSSGGGSSVVT